MKQDLNESIEKLEVWLGENQYMGYSPYDGLSSFLKPLTFHSLLGERILEQSVKHFPLNVRPLIGIKPKKSPIAMGYLTAAFLLMYRIKKNEKHLQNAQACLDWLIKNKSADYESFCWGNNFDHSSRGGRLPKFEPTIVWSSIIGQSFLNAFEILKNEIYLHVAESICEWILEIPKEETNSGICLSYVAFDTSSIHNSNMLGSAILMRTGRILNNNKYMNLARKAMEYSCSRQLENGAWYYGEDLKYHWIDNFHTGYNLDSLKCYIENSDDKKFTATLGKGFNYYLNNFFDEQGRPKYYHDKLNPIDIQCCAQAIDTLVNFADYNDRALKQAEIVADWTIENMQDKSGYFYYRFLPFKKVKIPMIHWGQATIYKSLVFLSLALNRN